MISKDVLNDKIAEDNVKEKEALRKVYGKGGNSVAKNMFKSILDNVKVAEEEKSPICQDAVIVIYCVKTGENFLLLGEPPSILKEAAVETIASTLLRPSAMDIITGKNSGDNI